MNSERIKRADGLRQKAWLPVVLGVGVGAVVTVLALIDIQKPEKRKEDWETIQLNNGSSYSLGDLDDDGSVDVVIENRGYNQMSDRTLFITEKFRNSKYNRSDTKIMPTHLKVAATRAYLTKRGFSKQIQEALRKK